jgi:hypothetical protein
MNKVFFLLFVKPILKYFFLTLDGGQYSFEGPSNIRFSQQFVDGPSNIRFSQQFVDGPAAVWFRQQSVYASPNVRLCPRTGSTDFCQRRLPVQGTRIPGRNRGQQRRTASCERKQKLRVSKFKNFFLTSKLLSDSTLFRQERKCNYNI